MPRDTCDRTYACPYTCKSCSTSESTRANITIKHAIAVAKCELLLYLVSLALYCSQNFNTLFYNASSMEPAKISIFRHIWYLRYCVLASNVQLKISLVQKQAYARFDARAQLSSGHGLDVLWYYVLCMYVYYAQLSPQCSFPASYRASFSFYIFPLFM